MPEAIVPAAEFQALPLEYIISAPLLAAVKAQAVAAAATRDFITTFVAKDGKPENVEFNFVHTAEDGAEKSAKVSAPLLSMIPVPHLRIDSLTVHFTYQVTQTYRDVNETSKTIELGIGTAGLLSKWVNVSIKGNASSKASQESTMNRSGQLEITLHASEAPIPEGLARLLSLLASSIPKAS